MSLPMSKFNFSEGCDKLKDQYNLLFLQFNNLKNEADKLRIEKNNVARHYGFYYEVSCALNCELHRYLEGLRRINLACNNILPHLPQEQQTQMTQIIDFIKQLTTTDVMVVPNTNGNDMHRSNSMIPTNDGENIIDSTGEKMSLNDRQGDMVDEVMGEPTDVLDKLQHDSSISNKNNGENENGTKIVSGSLNRRDGIHNNGNIMYGPPPPSYISPLSHYSMYAEMHPQVIPIQSQSMNGSQSHGRSSSRNMRISSGGDNSLIPPSTMSYGLIPSGSMMIPPPPLPTNSQFNSRRIVTTHITPNYETLRFSRSTYRQPSSSQCVTPVGSYSRYSRHSMSRRNSPNTTNDHNIPKSFTEIAVLPHGDVVCTVTTTSDRLAITGGKGSVKIWDISKNIELVGTVDCLVDKYIRSCKTTNDKKVVVAGEANFVTIFDMGIIKTTQTLTTPNNIVKLDNNTNACYALALSPDGRLCYGGCSNGYVVIWDIVSNKIVRAFSAHSDGISCLDISPDGSKLYTGSLDRSAKAWDLRDCNVLEHYAYNAQVYAIASIPNNDWICAGLENSLIDVSSRSNERFELELHKSSVLSMKVAPTFDWMVSVGKDNIVNCIRTPYGPPIYQIIESSSVLCCDISPDSKWVITGSSQRKASIYELQY